MKSRLIRALGALWLVAGIAQAAIDPFPFDDPALEARFKVLIAELRCLVCQNQNLADSNAELAVDLRRQVHEQLHAGKTDAEIVNYMVARYGDFVLYRPPVKASTAFLWFGPFVFVIGGVGVLLWFIRRRAPSKAEVLSDDQRERAERLLAGEGKDRA